MKKTLKNCSNKKNRVDKKVIFFVIASVIAMITIHFLFCLTSDNWYLIAKWSAGEILTYIGTVILGGLTIWQNDALNKANNDAQERLERLTKEANRTNIVNKVIEYEMKKRDNYLNAAQAFANATNPERIVAVLGSTKEKNDKLADIMEAEGKLDEAFYELCPCLHINYSGQKYDYKEDSYENAVIKVYESTKKLISLMKSDKEIKLMIIECNADRVCMEKYKASYNESRIRQLDLLVYSEETVEKYTQIY